MTELQRFKNILKKAGYFATKPRTDLFKFLQSNPEVSVNLVIDELSDQNQATIYRSIKLFEQLGIVNRLQLGSKSKLELSNQFHDHHHHMNCTECGKVIAWEEDPTIELRIQTVALKLGFSPKDHQLEIRGLCENCQ